MHSCLCSPGLCARSGSRDQRSEPLRAPGVQLCARTGGGGSPRAERPGPTCRGRSSKSQQRRRNRRCARLQLKRRWQGGPGGGHGCLLGRIRKVSGSVAGNSTFLSCWVSFPCCLLRRCPPGAELSPLLASSVRSRSARLPSPCRTRLELGDENRQALYNRRQRLNKRVISPEGRPALPYAHQPHGTLTREEPRIPTAPAPFARGVREFQNWANSRWSCDPNTCIFWTPGHIVSSVRN